MRRFLLFLWLSLLPMLANAYKAYIDGIYYNFSGNNATVTYRDYSYNSYSGTVVIPESVTYGDKTYSVTSIGSDAFCCCSGLTSITIGDNVTSICDDAFRYCSGLTSVTIGNSVTSIGYDAFYGCTSLQKVIVSDIGAWCAISFGNDCANPLFYAKHLFSDEETEITNLVIHEGVTSIGSYAFYCCNGLTSITIPNSVTSIGGSAFFGCSSLQKVIVSDIAAWCVISFGNEYANPLYHVGHLFSDEETEITNLVIPEGVTSIGDDAFCGCSGLTSVTIGNSVTSIGESAFGYCSSLTSVTIGDNVTSIGSYAFESCRSLTSVTIPNSVTSIGSDAFESCI